MKKKQSSFIVAPKEFIGDQGSRRSDAPRNTERRWLQSAREELDCADAGNSQILCTLTHNNIYLHCIYIYIYLNLE